MSHEVSTEEFRVEARYETMTEVMIETTTGQAPEEVIEEGMAIATGKWETF